MATWEPEWKGDVPDSEKGGDRGGEVFTVIADLATIVRFLATRR
jgi:hypothetical protein